MVLKNRDLYRVINPGAGLTAEAQAPLLEEVVRMIKIYDFSENTVYFLVIALVTLSNTALFRSLMLTMRKSTVKLSLLAFYLRFLHQKLYRRTIYVASFCICLFTFSVVMVRISLSLSLLAVLLIWCFLGQHIPMSTYPRCLGNPP